MRRRKADQVNFERFTDPESGGDVMYQGEEVFTGRPHATEDSVKGFIAKLINDPQYDTDDELELGRMAATYFQLQGVESPTHPIWDWVDDVMDDMMKRRHSSTREHLRGRRYAAEDDTALERYDEPEEVDVEVVSDTWKVDEHYWGLEAEDGWITRVRLGNWSDAGWHWSDDGDGLLIFLYRLARSNEGLLEEFADEFPNPEFRRAIERTFAKQVKEAATGINTPLNSLAYAMTGDNAGWHFGGNDEQLNHAVEYDLEYVFEDDTSFFQEALAEAFKNLRKFGIRLGLADVDMDELQAFVNEEFWFTAENCSLDENKLVAEFADDIGDILELDSPWSLMESAADGEHIMYAVDEWMNEPVHEQAYECVADTLEKMMPKIIEWAIKNYGEETPKELGEGETMPSSDPRQMDLPLEAQVRIASAVASWQVKAARIPKEMLRGFEFAQSVEFIYPDTGEKGFGRIMDFTRSDEGLVVSIAPHLYQEEEEWFRQDPHDFVDVNIDNVFPTKEFKKTFDSAPWRPRAGSYGTESSSPMFRTDGDGELEFSIVDEMLNHPDMSEMIDVAIDMSSRGSRVVWGELAQYLNDIYSKYGESEELAAPADWQLVAERVYNTYAGEDKIPAVASTRRRTARRGDDIGRPKMHREQSFGEDQFNRFTHVKNPKKRTRRMNREEGGYKSKKKLKEFLQEKGVNPGWSNETYGKDSMIYLSWESPSERTEWENRLEDAGFKVHRRYWPGSSTSEIQVSYFKGHHWDE